MNSRENPSLLARKQLGKKVSLQNLYEFQNLLRVKAKGSAEKKRGRLVWLPKNTFA